VAFAPEELRHAEVHAHGLRVADVDVAVGSGGKRVTTVPPVRPAATSSSIHCRRKWRLVSDSLISSMSEADVQERKHADGLIGDHSTLFTKSILDFIIIIIFASTYGKGAIFSALPVGVLRLRGIWHCI